MEANAVDSLAVICQAALERHLDVAIIARNRPDLHAVKPDPLAFQDRLYFKLRCAYRPGRAHLNLVVRASRHKVAAPMKGAR